MYKVGTLDGYGTVWLCIFIKNSLTVNIKQEVIHHPRGEVVCSNKGERCPMSIPVFPKL